VLSNSSERVSHQEVLGPGRRIPELVRQLMVAVQVVVRQMHRLQGQRRWQFLCGEPQAYQRPARMRRGHAYATGRVGPRLQDMLELLQMEG